MGTQENKQLVKDAWASVSNGDAAGFFSRLADDVTWTFFGTHRFAGTLRGKQEVIDKLFTPLGDVLADGIKVHIDTFTAEDDRVIIESRGEAKSKTGQRYDNFYCIVITVRAGEIAAIREYLDTELVTAVFGK